MPDVRRDIPRTDVALADPRLAAARARLGVDAVKAAVRGAQQKARDGEIAAEAVVDVAAASLPSAATTLRPILNATGVVLHTNLGRAPLAPAAVDAVGLAAGYVDVEYDVETGRRARRGRGMLDALLARVPVAEDALVVNNGAAALILVATALAQGKEIILSRGEMVEIGDGFRLPDLLTSTGARIREVGTTNRTNLSDYASVVNADTGIILKIHPSNFRVEGFTSEVRVNELATLGVPVVGDIGSGLLQRNLLLPAEPDATTWLTQGASIVTASGDKLLGGPQAGLVLGDRGIVHTLRRHPLARALRVDKITLAALEATLRTPQTPTDLALRADSQELKARASALASRLTDHEIDALAVQSNGTVGGGGAPGSILPGWAVRLPDDFASPLRQGSPSVVGRVEDGHCLLDLRCILPADDDAVYDAVLAVALKRGEACM